MKIRLPKIDKIPSGAKFIITGKKCINKQISKLSETKTFWVIQNNSFPLECSSKINKIKNAKQISTFDFSALYTKISHYKLLDILYEVVDFVFKGGTRDYTVINKQGCASWPSKKRGHHTSF